MGFDFCGFWFFGFPVALLRFLVCFGCYSGDFGCLDRLARVGFRGVGFRVNYVCVQVYVISWFSGFDLWVCYWVVTFWVLFICLVAVFDLYRVFWFGFYFLHLLVLIG